MKKASIALLVISAALSGCVGAPMSFLQSTYADTKGTSPYPFTGKLAPKEAAQCMLKNLDVKRVAFTGALSPEPPVGGVYEIRAKSTHGFAAIAEAAPMESGSKITVWVSNHYTFKGSIAKDIADGC